MFLSYMKPYSFKTPQAQSARTRFKNVRNTFMFRFQQNEITESEAV